MATLMMTMMPLTIADSLMPTTSNEASARATMNDAPAGCTMRVRDDGAVACRASTRTASAHSACGQR